MQQVCPQTEIMAQKQNNPKASRPVNKDEKKERKVRRQKDISLHQSRKGDALAQKSHESPSTTKLHKKSANGDLESYWKHPAPEPGCEKHYYH
eukprot:1138040-Pelagomonas_calceolata.AAC.2